MQQRGLAGSNLRCIFLALMLIILPIVGFEDEQSQTNFLSFDSVVPDDYTSIQDALNAAHPNQSIYVRSGTYRESILIEKSVSLIGENASTTIIEGNGTKVLVRIVSDNVLFSRFSITNAETGIVLNNATHCTIKNCAITNVKISSIATQGMGIYAKYCDNISITHNYMRDIYYTSVHFINTIKSQIARNTFIATTRWNQPVFLAQSHNNSILWNDVLGHLTPNEGGIGLYNSNNNTVAYNNIRQNDWVGISLRASNHAIIKGNIIAKHSWWGLMLVESNNLTIYCNNFIDNNMQLYLENVENISWSHAGYGNFWSDYTGTDENTDGIGETPYRHNGQQIDRYPLVGKCYHFELQTASLHTPLQIISNSTVENMEDRFNEGIKQLNFNVSGASGSYGFALIKCPHSVLEGPYGVVVDHEVALLVKELFTGRHVTIFYCLYLHNQEKEIISVRQRLRTDLNIDGQVGIDDLVVAGEAFGSFDGHIRWNPQADINKDSFVRILDLLMIVEDFSKSWI